MKKIISFVGLFVVLGVGIGDAHGVAMSAQVRRLLQEKQEKIEQLEKCEGKKQGWMIAGISTIGLTAVGVGVNIAQASKSNRLSDEIEMEKSTLERHQNELNRIQNDIAAERAKQAKKSGDDSHVYVPAGGAGNSPAGSSDSSYECRAFYDGDGIDTNSSRALEIHNASYWVWCGDGLNGAGCKDGEILSESITDKLMRCDNERGIWTEVSDSDLPKCEGENDVTWYSRKKCRRLRGPNHVVFCEPGLPGMDDDDYVDYRPCWTNVEQTESFKKAEENCEASGGGPWSSDDATWYYCTCFEEEGLETVNANNLLCQCIDKNKSWDPEQNKCIEKKSSGSGSKSSKSSKTGEKSTQKPAAPGSGASSSTNTGGRVVGGACIDEDIKKLSPYGWVSGTYIRVSEKANSTTVLKARCETKKDAGDNVPCNCKATACDNSKNFELGSNGLCVKKAAEEKEEEKKEEPKSKEKGLDVSVNGADYSFYDIDGEGGVVISSGCTISNPGDWCVKFNWGEVKGIAACSDLAGTYPQVASDQSKVQDAYRNNATPSPQGKECYCKMISPADSPWVFVYSNDDSAYCADLCAGICADFVRGNADFRGAVFGSAK